MLFPCGAGWNPAAGWQPARSAGFQPARSLTSCPTNEHILAVADLASLLFVFGAAAQDGIELKPFTLDHRAAVRSSLDLSFLLDAPAGKNGPIRVAGGSTIFFLIWSTDI